MTRRKADKKGSYAEWDGKSDCESDSELGNLKNSPSSNTSVQGSTEQIFEKFPKLPAELRRKIWKSSFVPRNLVVQLYKRATKSTCPITDVGPPVALQTCRESRSVALENYGTSWRPVHENFIAWSEGKDLYTLKQLNVAMGLPRQGGTLTGMAADICDTIDQHLNNGKQGTIRCIKFATWNTYNSSIKAYVQNVCPIWFNPEIDTVVFDKYYLGCTYPHLGFKIGIPWTDVEESEVRHLVLKTGINDFAIRGPVTLFPALESLTVLRDSCREPVFISFKIDDQRLLAPNEWAYSLEPKTSRAKLNGMVVGKSQQWNVLLSNNAEGKLWSRATSWRPDEGVWQVQRRQVMKRSNAEKARELAVKKHLAPDSVKLSLIPSGDGKTYLGPSKASLW